MNEKELDYANQLFVGGEQFSESIKELLYLAKFTDLNTNIRYLTIHDHNDKKMEIGYYIPPDRVEGFEQAVSYINRHFEETLKLEYIVVSDHIHQMSEVKLTIKRL